MPVPSKSQSAPKSPSPQDGPAVAVGGADGKMPLAVNKQLRTLAHDLSNALETIMQASYLLAQAELKEADKKWLGMVENASRDAARISREMREILRAQSE
jgi:signal transduction histidine kinase